MESTRARRHASQTGSADKKFACTFGGCTKRFTRAEHLQRHALNHTTGSSTCPRCSAHFKRPDLLDRHMNRHRQKDIEAGGEGCGVLDTRKRSWKAADGSVVERRPHPSERGSSSVEPGEAPTHASTQQFPSSPVSERESEDHGSSHLASLDHCEPYDPLLSSLLPACTASDPWQLWSEQPFQPDTASSFNMPYTTALDYNWLFNMSFPRPFQQSTAAAFEQQQPPAPFAMTPRSNSTITSIQNAVGDGQSWPGPAEAPPSHDSSDDRLPFASPGLEFPPPPMHPDSLSPDPFAGSRAPRRGYPPNRHPFSSEAERPLALLDRTVQLPSLDRATHDRLLAVIANAKPCLPDSASTITSVASLCDLPLLSQTSLQSYLDLYFTRFNVAYPIIHLATFNPSTVEPLLLLSIILLGATYAPKDAHQIAVCIHDVIRPSVFAHDGFSARPELWTLQTILLVECFGKSRAGQKQHDMSHLFHGLLINLIRRSDCQSVRPTGPPPSTRDHDSSGPALERAWLRWAEAEQKKRLALYCFMWDTQHAVLFCQSLCMSAFELRLHFPCSQSIWEAPNPATWAAAWWSAASTAPAAAQQPPFYLPTLRAYLLPGGSPPPTNLNAHARMLVLHGLMSIFWDMQRRDQTSLGAAVAAGPGDTHWRDMIAAAYSGWKTDFDAYCATLVERQNQSSDFVAEISTFAAAANAVYHAAQCLLRMEFLDIQIYAGARHILGRPVQQRDYLRSAQVVRRWASSAAVSDDSSSATGHNSVSTADASGAAWHAACMLREVVPEADSEAMASLFHVPWCLYLATLTCWAFHHASPSRPALREGSYDGFHDLDADEMIWDSHGEMDTLLASMATSPEAPLQSRHAQSRHRIHGLVWVMADLLTKVRWGIVHSGVLVLRGLVPARLINQYEADE